MNGEKDGKETYLGSKLFTKPLPHFPPFPQFVLLLRILLIQASQDVTFRFSGSLGVTVKLQVTSRIAVGAISSSVGNVSHVGGTGRSGRISLIGRVIVGDDEFSGLVSLKFRGELTGFSARSLESRVTCCKMCVRDMIILGTTESLTRDTTSN